MAKVTSILSGKVSRQNNLVPTEASVLSINKKGFHRIVYQDWGNKDNRQTIFCSHGLTRNSRDFDKLAGRLANNWRVICPDTAGRGKSDWLPDFHDYQISQYNLDLALLAASIKCEKFDFLGTSLGGMMGMVLASMKNTPVKRLIINDIAPEVSHDASKRLGQYLHEDPHFKTLAEAELYFREKYAPFAPMTDADWQFLAQTSPREIESGLRLAYDPAIANSYHRYRSFFELWKYWTRIHCPVLILRGKESDFLTEALLGKMIDLLPLDELIEFDGVGHTPTLNSAEQIDPILDWLDRTRTAE